MCSPSKELLEQSNNPGTNKQMMVTSTMSISAHCSPSTSGSSSPSSAADCRQLASYPMIRRDQLEVLEQLGAGTYGSVFRGRWERPDGTEMPVALKKVFMLEKEVEILSQIRHRNIIQFYGVSPANPDYWIVTEYAENGSLFDQLHNKEQTPGFERLLKWGLEIARGVVYLHHEAPLTVIHRDLKSKNIVIGRKNQCMLCDFGTSKDLTRSWTAPSWGGTAAWMSPEIISQRPEGITTACDVWSFGVVLWELFSHEIPYNGLTEFKIYSIISQHGVRLVLPNGLPAQLTELLQSCWRTEPGERPDMRYVLGALAQIGNNADLQREVTQFLTLRKDEWREQIREQCRELEELKLDLARQMEDLCRREAIVRKRENSHRNFLHMVDTLNIEDVSEWTMDCCCEWIQNIAASAMVDFGEEIVDLLINCVLQYEINGARLLKITEKDLEALGIEPVAVRRFIQLKLDELRAMNVQLCNFGCPDTPSTSSSQTPERPTSIEQSILLHVGFYSRTVTQPNGTAYRFKVFLDSDWESRPTAEMVKELNSTSTDQSEKPATELPDSSFLIKEVNISITAADHSPLLESMQCICPPFGYLEWAHLDAKDRQKMPLTVTIGVQYTDQVVQPRNTRIQIKLDSLASGPRTLCNKRVALRINRPAASDTCLARISSQMLLKSPPPSMNSLRARRRSTALSGSISPDSGRAASRTSLLNRSPIWADLAASIRNPSICPVRPISKSISLEHPYTGRIATAIASDGVLERQNLITDGIKEHKNNPRTEIAPADPIQRARQLALLKVRMQQQQQRTVGSDGRKKCSSETESSGIGLSQHHLANFYLSPPSTSSSSLSPSPFSPPIKNSALPNSGGSTADSEGSVGAGGNESAISVGIKQCPFAAHRLKMEKKKKAATDLDLLKDE